MVTHYLRRLTPAAALTLALLGSALVGTASAAHVSCGQTITQSTVLDGNVGPCGQRGIVIGADNITLDLNGFTIFGAVALDDSIGIEANNRRGVTIRNGTVTGFGGGVVIAGGGGNTVNRIVARDNIGVREPFGLGEGIAVFDSSGNRILRNVVRHNGPFSGISLIRNSDDNLVDSNVVQDNNIAGSPPAMEDVGILIEGPDAAGNTVRNNSVTGSGLDGIRVSPSPANTGNNIQRNSVRANGFHTTDVRQGNGILVEASATLVEDNISQNNAASGIRVDGQSNTLRSNTATNNAQNVTPRTMSAGGAFDLHDTTPACDANVWQGNIYGTRNQPCIN